MLLYIAIIVITFFAALFNLDKRVVETRSLVMYSSYLLCMILALVAGLRYDVGFDYNNYIEMFNDTPSLFTSGSLSSVPMELGYVVFISIMKSIVNSFQFQLLVFSIVSMYLLYKSILKSSPYPLISIFLYVCFFFFFSLMGQMRQAIAMIIIYFAYLSLVKEEKIKFFLLVFLAASFHFGAILFLPMYFLARKTYKKSTLALIILIAFLINFLLIDFIVLLIEKLYLANSGNYYLYKLYTYSKHYIGEFSILAYYEKIVIAILIISFYNNKNILNYTKDFKVYANIMIFGTAFYLVFVETFTVIGARGANYFLSFSIFLYPMLIRGAISTFNRYALFFVLTMYPLIRCVMKLLSEDSYHTYKTFLVQYF